MNREIKFRGKRWLLGDWIYGSLVITKFKDNPSSKYYITQFLGNYSFDHEVIPETVGQFTGLLDKNGKEIYEGDILKYTHYAMYSDMSNRCSFERDKSKPIINIDSVIYLDGCACFMMGIYDLSEPDWDSTIEVIGNIHENKELLEG